MSRTKHTAENEQKLLPITTSLLLIFPGVSPHPDAADASAALTVLGVNVPLQPLFKGNTACVALFCLLRFGLFRLKQ